MKPESEPPLVDEALKKHGIAIKRRKDGWLDLRGKLPSLERAIELKEQSYRDVIFGLGAGDGTELGAFSLSGSSFTRVRFTGCTFDHANLRDCEFFGCDFRYARFRATSFHRSRLANCDFYRAAFSEANVFSKAVLVHVSFDSAWLEGILGLDQAAFRHNRRWARDYKDWLDRIAMAKEDSVELALKSSRSELEENNASDPGTARSNGHGDQQSYLDRLKMLADQEQAKTPTALVQEADELSYFHFLFTTKDQRPKQYDLDEGLYDAALTASDTYRALAGVWSGQGQFDDSSFAYVRSKVSERRHLHPRQAARRRRHAKVGDQMSTSPGGHDTPKYGVAEYGSWLWLWVSGAVAKFGEGLWRAAAWLVAITIVPGILYAWLGAVRDVPGGAVVSNVWLGILFSLEQITTVQSDSLKPVNRTVELFGALQVLVGIGLLGLLAFVLGNKLRNA
jgi:Pentapeptide repeats (9 copies)